MSLNGGRIGKSRSASGEYGPALESFAQPGWLLASWSIVGSTRAWVRANSLVVLNERGDLSVISVKAHYTARVRLPKGKMPRGNLGDHRFAGDDDEIAVLCAGDVNDRAQAVGRRLRSAPTASARPGRRRPATATVRRDAAPSMAPNCSSEVLASRNLCPNKSTPGRSKFASGNRRAATSLDMAPMT